MWMLWTMLLLVGVAGLFAAIRMYRNDRQIEADRIRRAQRLHEAEVGWMMEQQRRLRSQREGAR